MTIGTKVLVIGGTLPNGQKTDIIEEFDLKTGKWKMCAVSLPKRMAGMKALSIGRESIYVCGGSDGKTSKRDLYVLDMAQRRFHQLSPIKTGRDELAFVISPLYKQLYVIGGSTEKCCLSSVEAY